MAIVTSEVTITGMHCASCSKVLTRAISAVPGVSSVAIEERTGTAAVQYDDAKAGLPAITKAVQDSGYGIASGSSAQNASVGMDFFSHLIFDRSRLHVERQAVKTGLVTFALLGIVETLAYYAFFMNLPNFAARNYGSYLFYLILAVTLAGTALWQLRAYHKKVSCQAGMMIGMTIGMLSGFMLGSIVGATNGMFVGSAYGMLVGMAFGAYAGRCCGIMGVMEGLMAGFMGGLMGAMTTFMLLNENVLLFFPLIFGSSGIILTGLTYLIYKDYSHNGNGNGEALASYGLPLFLSLAFALTMLTTWLIVYGPRSIFVQ
ncbi:MAG: heavy metal translocating P-type ATPase [Candidatus Aenigmarchaeota archaeon]|nr:heavy metal translocating P-type ATPase [Candidatus Aenigmarchaeota archaeon]